MDSSLVASNLRQIDSFFLQLLSLLEQLLLLSLVLLDFFLEHICNRLVSRRIKVIGQSDFFVVCEVGVVVDRWVQVEQDWQID